MKNTRILLIVKEDAARDVYAEILDRLAIQGCHNVESFQSQSLR
ncbi:MAG: hypothetical protein V1844_15515 [Pseudomonadota bacterium]